MIRKLVEKLFWRYQERDNWRMKMNEPIAIKKLTKEEAQNLLLKKRHQNIQNVSDHCSNEKRSCCAKCQGKQ